MTVQSCQPLHVQVYRRLADDIACGLLCGGDRLPAERSLVAELGVSRATVRRALRALQEDGLVESARGRGSFVCGVLDEPPNALLSFTELGARQGLTATARVLRRSLRAATREESERFGIAPRASLHELERVRLLEDEPVAVDRALVPVSRVPDLERHDFAGGSLYAVLAAAGAAPARADYAVSARTATPAEATLLAVEPGWPLVVTDTIAYDAAGRVVEIGAMAYRADRYRFRATLVRRRSEVPTEEEARG